MAYYRRAPQKSYPTKLIVAAAMEAFKRNQNQMYRTTVYNDDGSEKFATNSIIVNALLENESEHSKLDLNAAQEAIDFLHGHITMNVFMGKRNSDFTTKLVAATEKEETTDVGMLLYFPSVYLGAKKAAEQREQIIETAGGSEYIGRVGDKLRFNLTVIKARYLAKYDSFIVQGTTDDGNMISFWTKKEECTVSGTYTGKVKKHDQSQWTENVKTTELHFVKKVSQ